MGCRWFPGLVLACLGFCLAEADAAAQVRSLPESAHQDLQANFFMDEALELLRSHPTPEMARRYLERLGDLIQPVGSQIQDDQIADGYVSRVPERFVSITLFFDRNSNVLFMVHVVMSPGMAAHAERLIEEAFGMDPLSRSEGASPLYWLGSREIEGGEVRVLLGQQPSPIGTIHSVNYALEDLIPETFRFGSP